MKIIIKLLKTILDIYFNIMLKKVLLNSLDTGENIRIMENIY